MRIILVSVLFIVGTFADPPKTVKVGVQASWNSAPLALEASEFLYEAEPSLFWEYFESFQVSKEEEELTDTVSRSMAVNLVKERLSPLRSDLLDFALHTRQLSPRVEMVRKAAASELPKDDDTCIFMFFSLFVKNFPVGTTEEELRIYFSTACQGEVTKVMVVPGTQQAFVNFEK